ncbi:MAG: type II toxin-antitoxin system PrlF family antitoxin [Candidatus Rokubacteria bacterium]|nr:type II toxin-antitoxin system PrlF family antitoxin [Candidatus Rokubacteria bacterium]
MPATTLTSKGQVTIPKLVRDFLRIKPGDRLDFVIEDDGRVVVRPGTGRAEELKGLLYRPGRRPVSVAEMDAAIRSRHRQR